jgi:hypothetical protein
MLVKSKVGEMTLLGDEEELDAVCKASLEALGRSYGVNTEKHVYTPKQRKGLAMVGLRGKYSDTALDMYAKLYDPDDQEDDGDCN